MAIIKTVLVKELGDAVKYIYPRTSADMVEYNAMTVQEKLDTIKSNVPEDAVFTDTTYEPATVSKNGLMSASDKKKLDDIKTDDVLDIDSTNPVQNKVIVDALDTKSDKEHEHDNATNKKAGFMSASDKIKLDKMREDATRVDVDESLSATSTNPVQSKAIYNALQNKSNIDHEHDISTLNITFDDLGGVNSLYDHCETITNWNDATSLIWYISNIGAKNAPTLDKIYVGRSLPGILNNNKYIIQEVYDSTASNKYVRYYNNSSWSSWEKWIKDSTDCIKNISITNNKLVFTKGNGAKGEFEIKDTTYTSLKNPYSLTIQGNGTTLKNGIYDGSEAKTVDITPASIGAPIINHFHSTYVKNIQLYNGYLHMIHPGANGLDGGTTSIEVPLASQSVSGYMSASDKIKLDKMVMWGNFTPTGYYPTTNSDSVISAEKAYTLPKNDDTEVIHTASHDSYAKYYLSGNLCFINIYYVFYGTELSSISGLPFACQQNSGQLFFNTNTGYAASPNSRFTQPLASLSPINSTVKLDIGNIDETDNLTIRYFAWADNKSNKYRHSIHINGCYPINTTEIDSTYTMLKNNKT